tara:strand:+ start:298 stop:648 length:351 start_codon:yes stop_codon:yes gene_type:complete
MFLPCHYWQVIRTKKRKEVMLSIIQKMWGYSNLVMLNLYGPRDLVFSAGINNDPENAGLCDHLSFGIYGSRVEALRHVKGPVKAVESDHWGVPGIAEYWNLNHLLNHEKAGMWMEV